jgi:hypothetical protein
MKELKYWGIAVLVVASLFIFSTLFGGCATTGSITPQIIGQSAAVDTAVSQLQGQQAESARAAQSVSDTAESIMQTSDKINNPELSERVKKLNDQTKALLNSQQAEREKAAKVQTTYTTVKTSAGTELVTESARINTLTSQLKLSHKWNWILGVILGIILLGSIVFAFLKFYFPGK